MVRRRNLLALSIASPVLSSCAREPEATRALRNLGISYSLPPGWTQEDAEDRRAVFMLSSETEAAVAASAMIELPVERKSSEIPWKLRERAAFFKENYLDYRELQLQSDFKIGSNFVGILAYSATKKNVPQTEQYILLGFGRTQTILVFTSIATDTLAQYREAVHGLLSSVRVNRREA
jgi:hypothetical protein